MLFWALHFKYIDKLEQGSEKGNKDRGGRLEMKSYEEWLKEFGRFYLEELKTKGR